MSAHLIIPILVTVGGLAACDSSTSPIVGGIGATIVSNSAFAIAPNRVHLTVGQSTQLTTNALLSPGTDVEWGSRMPVIASVTPTGRVTAVSPGTTTVFARLSSDTTRMATATVEVGAPSTAVSPSMVAVIIRGGTQ